MMTSTSYKSFIKLPESKNFIFQRVVYDEADTLQIPGFIFAQSHFTWFVTASPDRLSRNELQSAGMKISSTRKSRTLGMGSSQKDDIDAWRYLTVSCHHDYMKESIELPEIQQQTVYFRRRALLDALRRVTPAQVCACVGVRVCAGVNNHDYVDLYCPSCLPAKKSV